MTIPKGRVVIPLLGSANRDERRFADADRFAFPRAMPGPVGFGFGAHFCLGASLARLEATAALEALLPELPGRVRAGAESPLVDSYLVRGWQSLQLAAA